MRAVAFLLLLLLHQSLEGQHEADHIQYDARYRKYQRKHISRLSLSFPSHKIDLLSEWKPLEIPGNTQANILPPTTFFGDAISILAYNLILRKSIFSICHIRDIIFPRGSHHSGKAAGPMD